MTDILEHENMVRLGFFLGVFIFICLWEWLRPRRKLTQNKLHRWPSNLGVVAISALFLRVVFSTTAVGFAFLVQSKAWGFFNIFDFSVVFASVCSVVFLDLAIYLQHVMFHAVPAFWRLHRMHHSDLDFDVTTGLRFHPIEIILSMGIKFAVILLIGAPPIAVLVFEVLLNAMAMFNHGNIYLPAKVDKYLRWLIVTPDMHRVHHSIRAEETNSNFGFNLSWWDQLLGTYRGFPQDGHETMTIGIKSFRKPFYSKLHWLLIQPFLTEKNELPRVRDIA